MSEAWLFYHWTVLFLLVGMLGLLLLNLATFRSLKPSGTPNDPLFVSVLVPARNEEHRIGPCIASLMAQDYPRFELLVLNDHSEDATGRVAQAAAANAKSGVPFRILHGEPLPAGWTGKSWACHQLAANAGGDFLLFTDADTIHSPGTISSAMAMARATRSDLLSAWPRLITKTWSEKLVIPMLHILAMALYPHALLTFLQRTPSLAAALPPRMLRGLGAANGQFLLFTKGAYERIGGHEAIRSHMVEDVALGREVAVRVGEGMRLVNCDASRFVECRMYSAFSEVWEGFSKNVRPAFEDSPGVFFIVGLVQVCCFLSPCLLLLFTIESRGLIAAQVALIYFVRLILTLRFRTSWLSFFLHPFGHAIAVLIALNSWRASAGAGVTWKGRIYQVRGE